MNISYCRSHRARRLRITVDADAAVVVTVPPRVSLKEAEAFVRDRQAWIQKHRTRIQQRRQGLDDLPPLSDDALVAAQEAMFARLKAFSRQYDLPYARAVFRCQKTRWGSCSADNNISLNINLAFLPRHLQDYVLLHELCHVRHKNHSKAFWTRLEKICGGTARQHDKELRTCGMKITR